MDNKQAIELITKSNLPEEEKRRLGNLIEAKGWNPGVKKEVFVTIQRSSNLLHSQFEELKKQSSDLDEEESKEVKKIVEDTQVKMDHAVSEYNKKIAEANQNDTPKDN